MSADINAITCNVVWKNQVILVWPLQGRCICNSFLGAGCNQHAVACCAAGTHHRSLSARNYTERSLLTDDENIPT